MGGFLKSARVQGTESLRIKRVQPYTIMNPLKLCEVLTQAQLIST